MAPSDLVAVVTGGGAGIGAATARRFARDGYSVVVVELDPDRAQSMRDELRAAGAIAESVEADVADPEIWPRVAEVGAELGRVSALVCNAFACTLAPAHEMTVASWSRQLEVNLTGTFLAARALLEQLQQAMGSIVIVSSVHALMSLPGFPAYAASKGGLAALGRQLAVEYGPAVRVNTVVPGPIDTASWDGASARDRAVNAGETVLGRFGTPDEVAAAIAFLTSPEASYITGASLTVDGGWTVRKNS